MVIGVLECVEVQFVADGPLDGLSHEGGIQSLLHAQRIIQVVLVHDEARGVFVQRFAGVPLGPRPEVIDTPHGVEMLPLPTIGIGGDVAAILGVPRDGAETHPAGLGNVQIHVLLHGPDSMEEVVGEDVEVVLVTGTIFHREDAADAVDFAGVLVREGGEEVVEVVVARRRGVVSLVGIAANGVFGGDSAMVDLGGPNG